MKNDGRSIIRIDGLGAAACVALSIGAWFLIARPIQQEKLTLHQLRSAVDIERRGADESARSRDALRLRVADVAGRLEETAIQLEPSHQMNTKVARINALLESSNMLIEGTEVGTVRAEQWFQSVPVTISGSGRFSSCAAFMHRLRTEMPDTSIVGFRLSGSPQSKTSPGRFEFDLVWHAAPVLAGAAE